MPTRVRPVPLRVLLLVLTAPLAACGGGGGSSSPFDPGDVNDGIYSASEFGFVDPHPPGFHPFGIDSVVLQPRDELVVFPNLRLAGVGRVLDDRLAGNATVANLGTVLGGSIVVAAGTGNVDLEGGEEIVTLINTGDPQNYTARIVQRVSGSYQVVDPFTVPRGGGTPHVALGDVDGDGRDEIVVTTLSRLHVYDDREAGMTLLTTLTTPFTASERPMVFDADRDGRDEIAISFQSSALLLYDDALAGTPFSKLATLSNPQNDPSRQELMVGDFDGDHREELAIVSLGSVSFAEATFDVTLFGFVGTQYRASSSQEIPITISDSFLGFSLDLDDWQATALDPDGDGTDEIALVVPSDVGGTDHHELRLLRRTSTWTAGSPTTLTGLIGGSSPKLALCAADVDTTGGEDLYVAEGGPSLLMRRVTWNPSAVVTTMPTLTGSADNPLVLTGDLDADGTVLRHTGNKSVGMAEPIPLVILTAAPTKAGIEQNYSDTSTAYSVSSGSGSSIGVTTSSTYSVSMGLHTPADQLLGVGVSVEGSWETRWSDLETRHTSFVRGYSTGFQEDVVLFQGTLYLSYEYVIESARDPQLVGQLITFDFPQDAKTYKWTVDRFDATFPALALRPLLPHAVGDPTTYRDRMDVQQLVDEHVGWMSPDVIPVGATTGGTNAVAIELASESTSTTERTFTLTAEAEFSSILSSTRASSSTSRSDLYSVTFSDTTVYEGVVGDIAPGDWDAFQYDFGLAVYHHGVLAGPDNEPLPGSQQPTDTRPVQIVTFWTAPLGSAY